MSFVNFSFEGRRNDNNHIKNHVGKEDVTMKRLGWF